MKQISKMGLMYNTRKYVQYTVITYNGKYSEKIYTYLGESLCYTSETNKILSINYILCLQTGVTHSQNTLEEHLSKFSLIYELIQQTLIVHLCALMVFGWMLWKMKIHIATDPAPREPVLREEREENLKCVSCR